MFEEVKTFIKIKNGWDDKRISEKVLYLPNYYPQEYKRKDFDVNDDFIDIGCFGAVRPLKNHLLQAIASVKFADHIGKKLRFHVNVGRAEIKGEPVMSNLHHLFGHLYESGHHLITNTWTPREEFLTLCAKMDVGLQVSFSETFNIVGADLISQGVPLVLSEEIPWADPLYCARPAYCDEIFRALVITYQCPHQNVESHQQRLTTYTSTSENIWVSHFIYQIHIK